MQKEALNLRGLSRGDLVYHVLYGIEWVGILLEIEAETTGLASPRNMALVIMQPNTKYENFFRKNVMTKYKIYDNMGYVSLNWLFKLESKKGKNE